MLNTSQFFQKTTMSRNDLAKKVCPRDNILSKQTKINPYIVLEYEDLMLANTNNINVDDFARQNLGEYYKPESSQIESFSLAKFSSNLKLLMDARNYTRADLAEDTGISIKSINLYLEKKRKPNIDHLIKIANVLKINLIFLIK